MEKKKKIVAVLSGVIILVLLCIVCVFAYQYRDGVSIYDEIEILTEADEYVTSFHDGATIVEHSAIVTKREHGVAAVLVGYEVDNEYHVDCVYFVQDKYFDDIYHIEGSLETVEGEIVADSQYINKQMMVFVRGMNISKEISSFKIPALGYEAEVRHKIYLDIVIPTTTYYEIEISE